MICVILIIIYNISLRILFLSKIINFIHFIIFSLYIKWRSIREFKSNNGMLSHFGAGMLPSKIVPSAKIVSIKAVFNVKLIKYHKDKLVKFHGVDVIMPIIHIALLDGPVKRKIPVHSVKKIGLLLKLLNNDFLKLEI